MTNERWVDLDGAVNVRDLGGLPTHDGRTTRFGQALRSDNLQGLTPADVDRLTGPIGLSDVIDLRTSAEVVLEGPGPLTREPSVSVHHFSLYPEVGERTDVEGEPTLPWLSGEPDAPPPPLPPGGYYANYLSNRPDSVLAALRTMTSAPGASITHCAAGKDRTGVVCALALSVAGVVREAVIADYAKTGERLELVIARLEKTVTYSGDVSGRSTDAHLPRPEFMRALLDHLDADYGGPLGWLTERGWSDTDTEALRARLVG